MITIYSNETGYKGKQWIVKFRIRSRYRPLFSQYFNKKNFVQESFGQLRNSRHLFSEMS